MTKQPDLTHISPQILDLIHKRNILSSEDPVLYDTLFQELLGSFDPVDGIQCLNVKRLHDIRWDSGLAEIASLRAQRLGKAQPRHSTFDAS